MVRKSCVRKDVRVRFPPGLELENKMTVKRIVAFVILGLLYVALYWGVPALLMIILHESYIKTVGSFHLWTSVYFILSIIGKWAVENAFKKS